MYVHMYMYIQARFLLQLAIPPIIGGWLTENIPYVASRQECASMYIPLRAGSPHNNNKLEPRKSPIRREENLACKLHMI